MVATGDSDIVQAFSYNRAMPTEPTQLPTRRQALAVLAVAPAAVRAATLSSTPTDWTLRQASEQIRTRKISPVELTRACVALIGKLNPNVNAFITVMTDQAMAEARELEAEQHARHISLYSRSEPTSRAGLCRRSIWVPKTP